MFSFPPIPDIDGIHPLIVHFPIAFLLVAPIIMLIGIFWQKYSRGFFICGFILLIFGTIWSFVAVISGEAAADLVNKTPEIKKVLHAHAHLANSVRTFFTVMTLIYAVIIFLPKFFKDKIRRAMIIVIQVAFLVAYYFGFMMVLNTAYLGGKLVHEYDVRAKLVPEQQAPGIPTPQWKPAGTNNMNQQKSDSLK